jgi:hypothetical protein
MATSVTSSERQPTSAISQDIVVLVYNIEGTLYKRTYEYGAVGWDTVETLVVGENPDLVDQSGKLWLVWVDGSNIRYANSFDGGITLTPPNTLINNAFLPGITTLPNGFTGVACFV